MTAPLTLLLPAPGAALDGGAALLWVRGACSALSNLTLGGAARAAALGRRTAPACFDPTAHAPLAGPAVHLAFLGDLQRGVMDVARPLAAHARSADVDLLVSSGDFVSHGEAPYYGLLLEAFERAGLDTPMRVVPGNHDLWPRRSKDDDIGGALFEARFGPRHWAECAGPVLLVGLDTGGDWLIEAQLPWLEQTLAGAPAVPWICVSHRAPYFFDAPAPTPRADLAALLPVLSARPPLLFVSGHEHTYRDESVDGVRYIVNAHGGDVHGLALQRADFELLHVRVSADGAFEVEPRPYKRRRAWPVARDQFAVRLWADRRKPLGAFLGLPAALLLKALRRYVPVVHHPVERRIPSRDVLVERRRAFAGRTQTAEDGSAAP